MIDQAVPVPEDTSWQMHLTTLREQIQRAAQGCCVLWVNPAQGDPFDAHPSLRTRKVTVPIVHPRFDLKYAPYLVALNLENTEDAQMFKTSVQLAWESWTVERQEAFRGQPIAGWVLTDVTPKLLAQHWATYCYLHTSNGLTKLLRFHDPSVRQWLWPSLNATQQQQLLGPATSLIGFSRDQRLIVQGGDLATEAIPRRCANDRESPIKKLKLTPHQWHQVDDYATAHAAWIAWRALQAENASTSRHHPNWHNDVFDSLLQATAYGITDPQDRELFATHVLQFGTQFHLDPKMQCVWDKTRAGEFYGGAFGEGYGENGKHADAPSTTHDEVIEPKESE